MLKPTPPPYDMQEWRGRPFAVRLRMVCQDWAKQGYGTPPVIYIVYLVKIALLYVGGWCFFCSFSPGLGNPWQLPTWVWSETAFQKAVLWTMAYEGLGFGCGSGPLTGRYLPPVGGFLHFARPGTIKLPLFPGAPVIGGQRRGVLDVTLYVAYYALLMRALLSATMTLEVLLPVALLLPILGVLDKTLFISARAEHHWAAVVCFCFAGVWLPACKVLWFAIWTWAAISKLTPHFPSVVSVMLSNSPLVPVRLRRFLYRAADDLRPSRLVIWMAHLGTLVELLFPLALMLGEGGRLTVVGLMVMVGFHAFITCSIPMGVPLEWNVIMVYGAVFLFGQNASAPLSDLGRAPALLVLLGVGLVVVPLVGNFKPSWVSFLMSMRYYAGNWAFSIWLFRGDSSKKLDRIKKIAPRVREQLAVFYDEDTIDALMAKVVAFRAMHLHGRVLPELLPLAVDDIENYEWLDGEIVAGLALGYNFGDGHLHDEQLLAALQSQCDFEPGELRCIFVEAQSLGGKVLPWRVVDASTGELSRGQSDVAGLGRRLPWPAAPES